MQAEPRQIPAVSTSATTVLATPNPRALPCVERALNAPNPPNKQAMNALAILLHPFASGAAQRTNRGRSKAPKQNQFVAEQLENRALLSAVSWRAHRVAAPVQRQPAIVSSPRVSAVVASQTATPVTGTSITNERSTVSWRAHRVAAPVQRQPAIVSSPRVSAVVTPRPTTPVTGTSITSERLMAPVSTPTKTSDLTTGATPLTYGIGPVRPGISTSLKGPSYRQLAQLEAVRNTMLEQAAREGDPSMAKNAMSLQWQHMAR